MQNLWKFSERDPFTLTEILMLALFTLLVSTTSWVGDDAYITLRTVDNFVNGYGLTWNVAERVQAYTHPLWMFLLSFFYFFTRETFLTTIFLSVVVSLGAVWLLARHIALCTVTTLFALLALILSRAFVDYSTSGLENPLTHLLLALFYTLYFRARSSVASIFLLSTTVSLLGVNRFDTLLLCLPVVGFILWHYHPKKALVAFLLGQTPFILWELFSLFYYGFLFPNTAYAKLNTGIAGAELSRQGLHYLLNSLSYDPLLFVLIIVGILLPFCTFLVPAQIIQHEDNLTKKKGQERGFLSQEQLSTIFVALGIALYIFYVIRIGGDFMSGRYFTAPFFASICLIARYQFSRLQILPLGLLFIILIALSIQNPHPTLQLPPLSAIPTTTDFRGINDERLIYFYNSSLLTSNRNFVFPTHPWQLEGLRMRDQGAAVHVHGAIGMRGYFAGPNAYIVDLFGLSDPLLARLPIPYNINWRVGHFERHLPHGYIETLQSGENRLADPNLAAYYDKLSIITRGNLLDLSRLIEIWKINSGAYNHLIDWAQYRYPAKLVVGVAELSDVKPDGTPWDAPGTTIFADDGIEITLPALSHAAEVELSLDNNDDYVFIFLQGESERAKQRLDLRYRGEGLATRRVSVPPAAVQQGYDRIQIRVVWGDGDYSLGHFLLHE